jgi:hypothetical protein
MFDSAPPDPGLVERDRYQFKRDGGEPAGQQPN